MEGFSIFIGITFFLLYTVLAYWVFKKMKQKGRFPVIIDIYTGKEKKGIFLEYYRMMVFFGISIFSLIFWSVQAGMLFLFLAITQIIVIRKIITNDGDDEKVYEMIFEDNAEATPEKIILTKKYIYLGKPNILEPMKIKGKNKISLFDRIYVYFIFSGIERKGDEMIIQFGFLSIPMFKRVIKMPPGYQKRADELIAIIYEMKKNSKKDKMLFSENAPFGVKEPK